MFVRLLLLACLLLVGHAAVASPADATAWMSDAASTAREIRDLHAQEDMAWWAQAMFWATVGSLALSAGALWGLFRSLGQTRTAIKDNRELGEGQAKAYVHADRMEIGSENGLILHCHNTGQTPAKFLAVGSEMKIVRMGTVSDNLDVGVGCRVKRWSVVGAGLTQKVLIEPADKQAKIDEWLQSGDPDLFLLVVGSIFYGDVFDGYYKTDFAFHCQPEDGWGRFRRPVGTQEPYKRISRNKYDELVAAQSVSN